MEALRKTKILVVDDDEAIRTCLQILLQKDYDVYTAEDGIEALSMKRANDIRIVFTDMNMPTMKGDELCRRIREKDEACKIVAISGNKNLLSQTSKTDTGFNDFLCKPFNIARIKSVITELENDL